MSWLNAFFRAVLEYLKRVNKVSQTEIDAREHEKTQIKTAKSQTRQIRLTKKFMRRLKKWYRWAIKKGFVEPGEDKLQAYRRWQEKKIKNLKKKGEKT